MISLSDDDNDDVNVPPEGVGVMAESIDLGLRGFGGMS